MSPAHPDRQAMREELAAALREALCQFRPVWVGVRPFDIANALLPVVERLCADERERALAPFLELAEDLAAPVEGVTSPDGSPMHPLYGGGDVAWRIHKIAGVRP